MSERVSVIIQMHAQAVWFIVSHLDSYRLLGLATNRGLFQRRPPPSAPPRSVFLRSKVECSFSCLEDDACANSKSTRGKRTEPRGKKKSAYPEMRQNVTR